MSRAALGIAQFGTRFGTREGLPQHLDDLPLGYAQYGMTAPEVIDEIGRRLALVVPPHSSVVLFGSHARGDADGDSDYDILVIEPSVQDRAVESVRLRRELRDLVAPIDVVVVDHEHAERRRSVPGTMIFQALREGRTLANT